MQRRVILKSTFQIDIWHRKVMSVRRKLCHLKQVLCITTLVIHLILNVIYFARTHARTDARTHAHTHARTHAHKLYRIPKEQSKMDNPEKLVTWRYIRRWKPKQIQNTMYWTPISQANSNNVNKTRALLQSIGGKEGTNIVSMRKS